MTMFFYFNNGNAVSVSS